MKTVVTIIVYNRFANLQRWLNIWKQCNKDSAELIVIHTGDEVEKFKSICTGVTYIHRQNIGFDIGCLQDVCEERLPGFPDYDYLLWCTDDCVPIRKDFIKPFIETIQQPGVGIAAMQVAASKAGEQHVRTTGFMISKETSLQLTFPADPLTTKQQCYLFEHRGADTMTMQVRRMGLSCVQVAANKDSPMWDTGYWKRLDRQVEFNEVFGGVRKSGDKVTFICTIYNTYPQIISSLACQTHKNWELLLIHDGPNETGIRQKHINGDARIKFIETAERKQKWGHPLRQWALNEIREGRLSNPDYIVVTNSDNYYTPTFIEYMLKGFKTHTAVATYCDSMTHSYVAWKNIPVRFEKGFIDCGGVMVKKDIAVEVGWRDIESHSADWTYFSDIAAKYSASNFIKVPGNLFIHN